jgi:hypothetical protein
MCLQKLERNKKEQMVMVRGAAFRKTVGVYALLPWGDSSLAHITTQGRYTVCWVLE